MNSPAPRRIIRGMWYRITGVNRNTGTDATLNVQAASRQEAEQIGQRSLIVAEVELEPGYNPPPSEPIIPDYKAITRGASVLRFFSLLNYAVAILCLVGVVIALVASADRHESSDTTQAVGLLITGFWLLVSGAVLGMLAALGEAVRDMARNSFRR